jgi:outer membrane immunogenic protein
MSAYTITLVVIAGCKAAQLLLGANMKKTLLGFAAVSALMATPILAADMAVKAPPRAATPVYSWTSCYLGANIGGIWEHDTTPITLFDPTGIATVAFTTGRIASGFSYDRTSVLGGGQLGCNWQFTNWVVGIETDFDGSNLRGGGTSNTTAPGFLPLTSAVTQKLDWIGTTRGRVGVTAGNGVLLYGTAGVAYAGVSDSYFQSDAAAGGPVSIFASDSTTRFGWTAGGGAEVGFGQWSVKGEALYYDLGKHSLNANCTVVAGAACATPNTVFTAHFENRGVLARIGLNYHFNGAYRAD